MAQTYALLKAEAATILQDAGTAVFTGGELDLAIQDALREIAVYHPYVVRETFTVEGRSGSASTTLASSLCDSVKLQFVAGDVGKVVFNQTDKTYALVTAYVSASTLTISKDIMASAEGYQLFNKGCWSNKQVNIENTPDYLWAEKAEYPTMNIPPSYRNVSTEGDILTIEMDREPDDTDPANTDADREVYVYFAKRHKLSQLTDLSGLIAATAAVSATSIAMSSLQAAGTIEADQEFTIANVRGVYRTTAVIPVATTAVATFWPPLESAIAASGGVVTFKQSTLNPRLEPILVNWVAGKAAINKTNSFNIQINTAITQASAATAAITLIAARMAAATAAITLGNTAMTAGTAAVTLSASALVAANSTIASAGTALNLIDEQIVLASSALLASTTLNNTVPLGGGATDWINQAMGNIAAAQANIANGQGWISKASAEMGVSGGYQGNVGHDVQIDAGYLNTAGVELRAAATYINEAVTNMSLIRSRIAIAAGGRYLTQWGQEKLAEAKRDLKSISKYPTSQVYSRD
jgi:hypothetical protein